MENHTNALSVEDFDDIIKSMDYPYSTDTWKKMPQWEAALKISFYAAVIIVSLIGNGLVSIVLVKKKSLRCITNTFILNLAIADILVTCSSMWVNAVDALASKWVLGAVFCKLNVLIQVAALISSVLTMAALATERFFGIVTPFVFCTPQKGKTITALIVIWMVAFTVATPPAIFTELYTREWRNHAEQWCSAVWPTDAFDMKVINSRGLYYTVVSALLFAIPLLIMILAYTAIIIKLRRSNKSGVNEVNNNSQKAKTNSRKKVVMMLIIQLAVFMVCWLPLQFSMLYYEYIIHTSPTIPDWWHKFTYSARYLFDTNSACNPVIFICFSQKIRKAIKGLVCCKHTGIRSPGSSRYGSLRSSTKRTWV